jgi:hypothetical protein
MGSTSVFMAKRPTRKQQIAQLLSDIVGESTTTKTEYIAHEYSNSIFYFAIRFTKKLTNSSAVIAIVATTSYRDKYFTYKFMDELVHPFYYGVSEKFMNKLDDIDTVIKHFPEWGDIDGAFSWREMIQKINQPKAEGDIIRTKKELDYGRNLMFNKFSFVRKEKDCFICRPIGASGVTFSSLVRVPVYQIAL